MPTVSGNVGAVFNGGTITGALDVAYAGAAATPALKVVGSPNQTPANDWELAELRDGLGGLRFLVESNGSTSVLLDASNGGVCTVGDSNAVPVLVMSPTSIGFFGSAGVVKPAVTGSKGANAALTSLMTALAALGLVTDSTT